MSRKKNPVSIFGQSFELCQKFLIVVTSSSPWHSGGLSLSTNMSGCLTSFPVSRSKNTGCHLGGAEPRGSSERRRQERTGWVEPDTTDWKRTDSTGQHLLTWETEKAVGRFFKWKN